MQPLSLDVLRVSPKSHLAMLWVPSRWVTHTPATSLETYGWVRVSL